MQVPISLFSHGARERKMTRPSTGSTYLFLRVSKAAEKQGHRGTQVSPKMHLWAASQVQVWKEQHVQTEGLLGQVRTHNTGLARAMFRGSVPFLYTGGRYRVTVHRGPLGHRCVAHWWRLFHHFFPSESTSISFILVTLAGAQCSPQVSPAHEDSGVIPITDSISNPHGCTKPSLSALLTRKGESHET